MISTTQGTDVRIRLRWRYEDNTPLDLTGYSVVLLQVSKNLVDRVTFAVTDAVQGEVLVSVEGTDPIPIGYHDMRFQIVNGDGLSIGTKSLRLEVQ